MFLLPMVLCFVFNTVNGTPAPQVTTENGKIEGLRLKSPNGKFVNAYLGVPYAEPPINELRFKPPTTKQNWSGVYQAKTKPVSCFQRIPAKGRGKAKFDVFVREGLASEDCLYLNVWTPSDLNDSLAVLVYIYGGGYKTGSSNLDLYDGSVLATEGEIIVVNFNFRTSVFGLLYLGSEDVPGNMMLMDQAFVFRWVQRNIAAFGGDPDKVTIFGESSGSASASNHLLLPSSKGLFKRVVVDSGSILSTRFSSDKSSSLETSLKLSQLVGCNSTDIASVSDCLRSQTAKKLLDISLTNKLSYVPTVDGNYFPLPPEELIRKGYLDDSIDIMLGHCTADGFKPTTIATRLINDTLDFFVSEDHFMKHVAVSLGNAENASSVAEILKPLYVNSPRSEIPNWRRQYLDYITDTQVVCSTNNLADVAARNGNRVFKYVYAHVASVSKLFAWEEVAHTYELYFVFGRPLDPKYKYSSDDAKFSKRIIMYLANFAKHGSPNALEGNFPYAKWPRYSLENKENYVLQENSVVVDSVSSKKCQLIQSVPTYNDSL